MATVNPSNQQISNNSVLVGAPNNLITNLAVANKGVLTTDASGVPSIDTTNFVRQTTGMQMKGNNTNTAPPAGFIGEQIRGAATGVSLTTTVAANITSISVTAGIWDICGAGSILDGSLGLTFGKLGISVNTGSYTGCVSGDSFLAISSNAILANNISLSIPGFRVTLSATTTYYLVGQGNGAGTLTADGRISATRVG